MLALAPGIAIAALAPLVGEQFALVDAVVYGLCAFVVASLFFAVAVFLSTLFNDVWRPSAADVPRRDCACRGRDGVAGDAGPVPARWRGRSYFYDGALPWFQLLLSAVGAAAFIYAAAANVARRDF